MLRADAVLASRCHEDDRERFDEIVARHRDGIYNYIWRMISNRQDVEDLTQEVFVRAFASWNSFRHESNVRTWLYRIATNLCVDKYRRAGVEKRLIVPLEQTQDAEERPRPTEHPDSTYDPRRACERMELQAEVQRALSRLPEKLRSAVLLCDLEGMSYEEIAETVGCPVGTVKSRLFNARMRLRTLLKPYVEDSS